MVLLQRNREKAAYSVDVIHRVLTPILLMFGSFGVFEQDKEAQQGIFTAMGVFIVLGIIGSVLFLRWRLVTNPKRAQQGESREKTKMIAENIKQTVVVIDDN
jgi:Na+/melibiose symporter-like transporter